MSGPGRVRADRRRVALAGAGLVTLLALLGPAAVSGAASTPRASTPAQAQVSDTTSTTLPDTTTTTVTVASTTAPPGSSTG